MPTLQTEYITILEAFARLFSKRIWEHAKILVIGAILCPAERTVCAVLRVMGLSGEKHFQNYHRVLTRAVWSSREASHILLDRLIRTFAMRGPVILGLDDTIERRRGARIKAKGIYRDPVRSTHSHFVKASGLRWLSLMLLAAVPWAKRVWALPFLTVLAPSERYYQGKVRILRREFILQRDLDSYYETLRFTLMSEPSSREEIAMSPRTKRITRCATGKSPASGRKPTDRISARDVSMTADELQTFHRQFQPLFQRREQRAWSLLYLCGQLSNLERKTIEPMALFLLGPDPNAIRGMQQFIGQGEWESGPLLLRMQDLVSSWLSEEDGVVIVDGSGCPKQGRHSVGVARQYCGALGKIANCQEGVFLAYASQRGYAFVDERLYMPEEWFSTESRKRWHACGIPENLAFRTEPELGLEMITALVEHDALPFRGVTCDEKYGKIPAFLDGIAALDKWYLAEVVAQASHRTARAWSVGTPPPLSSRETHSSATTGTECADDSTASHQMATTQNSRRE